MSIDNRRWKRVDVSVLGTFVLPEQYSHGTLRAVDFCRQGMRAQVQRSIPRGSTLGVEMQLPGKETAEWVTGRVIWVKINPEPSKLYPFETGIQVDAPNDVDVPTMMLAGCEEEVLAKTAETATYKGILFRNGVRSRDDYIHLAPTGLLAYSAIGAVISLFNAGFGAYYIVSLGLYFLGLCVARYVNYRRKHDKWGISAQLSMVLPMAASIILTHLCQGLYFLRVALNKNPSALRA